jgi:ribosomal protein S18 acetylase RimI-like enzyme
MTTRKAETGAGVRVSELPDDLLVEAAGVLTRSFLTNPNFVNLFPDDEVRARALPHVQRACLRDALRAGHVYAANRGGEIVGVAAWLPPGWFPLSVRRQLRAAPDIARVFRAAPRSLGRLLRFTSGLAKLHPAQPHWYLEAVGVEPGAQGMGIGTRLLEPVLARVDEEGQPCYLETMTERNVAWYRRLGFEVRSAGVTFTRGGPPNWTMLRRPGATVGGTRSNGGGGVP